MSTPNLVMMPIAQLRPNPRNARTHSKKQIRQIANSIQRFGWTTPVVVDEHGNIIAGHGRHLAALELGQTQVPTIVASYLSKLEQRALALADNKIAANAGYDRKLLATELGELVSLLPEIKLDLSITGFETAEIDALATAFIDPEHDPADAMPPRNRSGEAVSRRGDLWLLGEHRLLCGDSCNENDCTKVMADQRAGMVFADAPYNRSLKTVFGHRKIKYREFAHGSGEMTPDQFTSFLEQWMELALRHSTPSAMHFICMDWRHANDVLAVGGQVYGELKNLIVWVKSNPGQGSLYRSQHELIFLYKSGDAPHQNNIELGRFGRNRSNVWQYSGASSFRKGRLEDLAAHPTIKPVALVADAIRDCTKRNDVVFDPFIGSGTTILAAERTGRRGFGLEIDPLYVDLAIRRWQDFARKDAIRKSDGRTFDELSAISNSNDGAAAP